MQTTYYDASSVQHGFDLRALNEALPWHYAPKAGQQSFQSLEAMSRQLLPAVQQIQPPPYPINWYQPSAPCRVPWPGQQSSLAAGRSPSLPSQVDTVITNGPMHLNVPRGPPQKPRRSGNAVWVGNLPGQCDILSLKDHFAAGARAEIESVFLISRTNCAFVNYRSEASCIAAKDRFHNSAFRNRYLVCRLRKSFATYAPDSQADSSRSTSLGSSVSSSTGEKPVSPVIVGPAIGNPVLKVPEKYFILKSLTLHELESSLAKGTWATQKHNESVLNKAFAEAEAVYLIFSANKSGEYFGYARMTSAIPHQLVPQSDVPSEKDAEDSSYTARTMTTPATATAPKGRIVDDLAHGTIFWEADIPESEQLNGGGNDYSQRGDKACREFRIQWINTTKLPFFHTRGLRNQWNANREVKVARDGTELEPKLGKHLLQLFDKTGPAGSVSHAPLGRMW